MFFRERRAFVLAPLSVAALLAAVAGHFVATRSDATVPPSAASLRLGQDVVPTFQAIRLELDPRKADYTGSVEIDLDVKKSTRTFRLHAEQMAVGTVSLSMKRADGTWTDVRATATPGEHGLLAITTDKALDTGAFRLRLEFTNDFNTQATSLYRLESGGDAYTFTQLEADDAREAFPCFDEPSFKIPWQMTLVVPEGDETVSNTPIENEERAGGKKTVRFARTKPMPSYLLAIATGPLDYLPIEGLSVPGRVVTVKGQAQLGAEAARITPPLLHALEAYFGRPYPYEKLDLIAVPEFWPGAMENAGAITFGDRFLLVDPTTANTARRKLLASFTAHEMAHMWFGDLVTMQWWDDLWLNESFASWMGEKVTHQVYPEFGTDLTMVEDADQALRTDGKLTSRAIRQPVSALANLLQSADVLAYKKGQAVLGMFERWAGEAEFRQGVRDYIATHAWGNATAQDLWQALSKASGKGVSPAMATFLEQPGMPLVTVELLADGRVRLSQERFLAAGTARPKEPQLWQVPMVLKYKDASGVHTKDALLTARTQTVDLGSTSVEWVHPNDGAFGYYRWNTSPTMLSALARAAAGSLDARERSDFVYNASALMDAGVLHADTFLELLATFAKDEEPLVVSATLDGMAKIRDPLVSDALEEPFARYLRGSFGPTLERFGRLPREGEKEAVGLVRPRLIGWLADEGQDPALRAFCDSLARVYMTNPGAVDPALSPVALSVSATRGDHALYDAYRKRFETTENPAERRWFLNAISSFREPAILDANLDYSLTGPLKPQEIFSLFEITGDRPEERDAVFSWITKNYDAVLKRIPPMYVAFMPYAAGGCSAPRLAAGKAFFSEPKNSVPGMDKEIAKMSEGVEDCLALRQRESDRFAEFLSRNVGSN
ncbi:MAG: M1 family metallopeptidase [Candidatus Eiseniibacteriota bacterium]